MDKLFELNAAKVARSELRGMGSNVHLLPNFLFQNIAKKELYGRVREDVREIISMLCKYKNVKNIAGAVCVDHVHLSVAILPKISVPNFMSYLKGKSMLMFYIRYLELQSKWERHFGHVGTMRKPLVI